jgi:hypothetical protein
MPPARTPQHQSHHDDDDQAGLDRRIDRELLHAGVSGGKKRFEIKSCFDRPHKTLAEVQRYVDAADKAKGQVPVVKSRPQLMVSEAIQAYRGDPLHAEPVVLGPSSTASSLLLVVKPRTDSGDFVCNCAEKPFSVQWGGLRVFIDASA